MFEKVKDMLANDLQINPDDIKLEAELINDLAEIATNQEVYSAEELAEARECFDKSLKELPNCTLLQAYNCTVEEFGERLFPPEEEELNEEELAAEAAEHATAKDEQA